MSRSIDPQLPVSIGVDVGGTFTDAVILQGRRSWRAKSPTTTPNISDGVVAACELAVESAGSTLEAVLPSVERFGLGTTAVTNVIASRVGRRVGLITTQGMESTVPLARTRRVNVNGWLVMPPEVVAPEHIVGVPERLDRLGEVVCPLDVELTLAGARRLVDEFHVEAIVVSFLWSVVNPVHEQAAVAAIKAEWPDLFVISAAEYKPVVREYERTMYALLNAYCSDAFSGIFDLAEALKSRGLSSALLLLHSGGGSIGIREATRTPAVLAQSGPAAGVSASVAVAKSFDIADAVTCDMGGTSFDVSLIVNGESLRKDRGDLMGFWTSLSRVDVESIGAGGGSIAWVDAVGTLRVGPRSSGSVPGPACYGRGGTDPTVTDAMLVLGYLAEDRFLGGTMTLDEAAAQAACAELGKHIGLSATEVAWGIREVALAGMQTAVRSLLASRGLHPAENALISYGGSGGLFTGAIGRGIGSSTVVFPALSSVLSAFGAATADLRREREISVFWPMPAPLDQLGAVVDELTAKVTADLEEDEVSAAGRHLDVELLFRFKRQQTSFTAPIILPVTQDSVADAMAQFRSDYIRRYGEGALRAGTPIEVAGIRVVGTGRSTSYKACGDGLVTPGRTVDPMSTRAVVLGVGETRDIPAFDDQDLDVGDVVVGPALIDGADTTWWVPPRARAVRQVDRSLVMEV